MAVDLIEKSGVDIIKIRSALTCESKIGICAACYGRDLARGTSVILVKLLVLLLLNQSVNQEHN